MAVYYPSYASPAWPVATTVAAPAAAPASTISAAASESPVSPTLLATPLVASASPAQYFWPANPQPSQFTLPCATSYKRWRNTEAELGRFDQWSRQFARSHGLM